MKTATKRARARAVPRPAPSPLPTLADYGLKPRGELPGESWVKCCEQERAYTMGFRAGLGVGRAALLDGWYETDEERRAAWVLGCNDGIRVRERRASK